MELGTHVHFVGIGGYSLSGLARVLLQMGKTVSGSDVASSDRTRVLEEMGATVHLGHRAENLERADLVVYSTEIHPDNPELIAARQRDMRLIHRSVLQGWLMDERRGVAVAGTHGKTSTTSMTAVLLDQAGFDPTVLVGGEMANFGGTGRLGSGEYLVVEADESDHSFLKFHPEIAVATNVEPEHLEHYGGDFSRIVAAFEQYVSQVRPGGLAVLCGDDPNLRAIAGRTATRCRLYGFGPENELRAENIRRVEDVTRYDVFLNGKPLGDGRLRIPGNHMVCNSLAVIAVGLEVGIPFERVTEILGEFTNAKRRFQIIAEVGGVRVVDDYAHHPTEIRATLQAARQTTPGKVIAAFQPQRYIRTKNLMNEFSRAFSAADQIILTEIYAPPGEPPIPGVSSSVLADLIRSHEGREVRLIGDKEEMAEYLTAVARPGDTILTMGAGDIWKVAREVGKMLETKARTG